MFHICINKSSTTMIDKMHKLFARLVNGFFYLNFFIGTIIQCIDSKPWIPKLNNYRIFALLNYTFQDGKLKASWFYFTMMHYSSTSNIFSYMYFCLECMRRIILRWYLQKETFLLFLFLQNAFYLIINGPPQTLTLN